VISASFPALLILVLVREGISVPAMPDTGLWVNAAEWGLLAFASTLVIGGLLWARRHGLSTDQSLQLLLGATTSSTRWQDARINRVLAPASGRVRAPDIDTPSDYVRAIREMIAFSPNNANVGESATGTAELLLNAINECDLKLEAFSRDAGPEEESRLNTRLESLKATAKDSHEVTELREVLRRELELIRSMQRRRSQILGERERLVKLLRELWVIVREASDSDDKESSVSDRLEELHAAVTAELQARAVSS